MGRGAGPYQTRVYVSGTSASGAPPARDAAAEGHTRRRGTRARWGCVRRARRRARAAAGGGRGVEDEKVGAEVAQDGAGGGERGGGEGEGIGGGDEGLPGAQAGGVGGHEQDGVIEHENRIRRRA